ncbi:hypothetical protein FTX61_09610 [Nitriliruptoraceae bacterium ZYF776]|nr:hypothetical protein [Profundirhabdus halotolerans]
MRAFARGVVAAIAAVALVGCESAPGADPVAARPYLVSVDAPDDVPSGEVTGTLAVADDCIVVETDDAGTLFPLFAVRASFGPLDSGGRPTVDVAGERLLLGDEVVFAGGTGAVSDGVRSTYPGVDFTRCRYDGFAILGEVR